MTGEHSGSPRVVPMKRKKCPLCKKPAREAWRPFCSKRCADQDLGAWLTESYRIPAEEEASVEDEFPDDT
mgnify:CR=1 FL=1